MPQLGESPDSWDIRMRNYWKEGGATSGNATPSPAGTAVADMPATATSTSNNSGTATGNATSTPATSAGTSQGSGIGQGATSIQGVQLASKVLNAKVTVGTQVPVLGTSIPGAGGLTASTPSPSGGTVISTPTTSSGGTSLATSTPTTGTSTKNLSATIDDMIVNVDLGEIMYIVVKTNFDDGEHLIPVPLSLLKFDSTNQSFVLDVDAAMLQKAPSFQSDQFPDMTMPGWNSEFDSFWQNNGSGGTGTGSQATPTP
jgi:hypothetical protein